MAEGACYQLVTDPKRMHIRISFDGQLDAAALDSFQEEFGAAMGSLRSGKSSSSGCLLLVDVRRQQVQGQEVANRFRVMVDSYEAKLKKVAVIISDSVLHRIQVQRIGSAERQAFFRTEDEAVTWLFAE